jgi:RNA polymerase subunit RPABC4/transcription elongation factor Spt4
MEQRIFHGNITPVDIANQLISEFNQGNLRTQIIGKNDNLTVQISTKQMSRSGGQTALSINIQKVTDGVMIQLGQQQWLGVAASLGQSAIATLINPLNLLGRLDDIAQDIENLQITEKVWQTINRAVTLAGASTKLSDKLSRLTCEYCHTANELGNSNCIACGAPLGDSHPTTCTKCGWVVKKDEKFCPNCGQQL